MAMTQSSTMVGRMIRAAKLDSQLYEEVERDQSLTGEAITVVAIVSALTGLGALLAIMLLGGEIGAGLVFFIGSVVGALIRFFIWVGLTYFIGTRLFGGTADYGEMLRTLGYATSPQILALLIFIPILGLIIALAVLIWSIVAGVIAVRQALDFDTTKAVLTVVISFIVSFVIQALISSVLGLGGTPGVTG